MIVGYISIIACDLNRFVIIHYSPCSEHARVQFYDLIADGCHSVCDRNYPAVRTDVTDAVTSKPLLCKPTSAASLAASTAREANHASRQHPPTPGELPGLL